MRLCKGQLGNQSITKQGRIEGNHGDPTKMSPESSLFSFSFSTVANSPIRVSVIAKDKKNSAIGKPKHGITPVSRQALLVGFPVITFSNDLIYRVRHDQERKHEVEPDKRIK